MNKVYEVRKVYKGRVNLPKSVRDKLDVKDGDHIVFQEIETDLIQIIKLEKEKKNRFRPL